MNHFRLFGISRHIARHPIIETHPDSNQYVALIGIHIRSQITVHSQHSFIKRMLCGQDRESVQCTAGREVRSEEHTSELSHANISYAVFCLKKKISLTSRVTHVCC